MRNVLVYMGLLTSLGFISFLLFDYENGGASLNDRVTLLVSILFTLLALRFSVADAIPHVPTSPGRNPA